MEAAASHQNLIFMFVETMSFYSRSRNLLLHVDLPSRNISTACCLPQTILSVQPPAVCLRLCPANLTFLGYSLGTISTVPDKLGLSFAAGTKSLYTSPLKVCGTTQPMWDYSVKQRESMSCCNRLHFASVKHNFAVKTETSFQM